MRRDPFLAFVALLSACGAAGASRGTVHRGYAWVYDDEVMRSAEIDYARECSGRAQAASPAPVPVTLADGVDRCEAQAIADARVSQLGCGAVGPPIDDESQWLVPVRVNVEGRPLEPVQIDKQSGHVAGAPAQPANAAH